MLEMKGSIQGNTVVVEDDLRSYNGRDVIITILDFPYDEKKKEFDLTKFRGCGEKMFYTDAQEYVRELRDNDRL